MAEQAGLTNKEAEERLKQFGENKLKEKKGFSGLKILLSQFKSPLIYILVIASGVTWVMGDTVDAGVIGAAVILNTILGFFQELKAEKGLEALSKILTPKAKVIRDGQRQIIEAKEVVPGDVCILEMGEKVAADGVMIEVNNLSLNEAMLTGESQAVNKRVDDEVYMGTIVVSGIAKMLVKTTGQKTKMGKIAESLAETEEPATPLQKQLNRFAGKLTVIIGLICGLIFIIGWLKGHPLVEIFTTSVAIAVAAIPEGLVIALTVILAIGMQRIFKRKALVRKLLAAETLGSVTVIACDKTGTLTEGKMTVVKALTDDEPLLRKAAVWCNDLRDPLEIAMKDWAGEQEKTSRLDSIPFDPKTKLIVTLHLGLMLVSGAPEVVLGKCKIKNEERKIILKQFETEAKLAHRLVGFAYKNIGNKSRIGSISNDLIWLGVLVYEDPIREGVKDALIEARQAGIKVILITGDFQETAWAIAGKLGIAKEDVYSRATPEQKLKIVEELQARGEVVAMTGDGVNDAPALKKADIGIVVADASAVAQETADMVLLDSNFATILAAVEEGRNIFLNLIKVVYYLMANAFAEVTVVVGSMIFNWPLPVTAAQILWINLVNDSLPTFALIIDPRTKNLMKDKPIGQKRELMDREMKLTVVLVSLVTGLTALAAFYFNLRWGGNLNLSRSVAFTIVAVAPLLYSLYIGSFINFWLWLAVGAGVGLQVLVLYLPALQRIFKTEPLGINNWLLVGGASIMIIMMIEVIKLRFNKK
ncbi:MAG: HAD-IC family P-type ATPase [Candidatus Beckwithbacteria bacterium]|nr:HAD-IC family P-type ATPase [Candidatus Beckwithbacteria bacterium]